MRRLKALFLILVALWLPVQTAGAVVMPLQFAQEEGVSCHLHDEEAMAEVAAETAGECDDCRICHLAAAGFLLAASVSQPMPLADALIALPTASPSSHIGDPPQQPPRPSH